MQYFGGKSRIADGIAKAIKGDGHAKVDDMFCGGLSISVALVRNGIEVRRAIDGHEALINMYRAYQSGWRPPAEVTEETYCLLKEKKDSSDPMTAFAGFGCSFSGRYFEGYARNSRGDNYVHQARSGLARKFKSTKEVEFLCMDYQCFEPTQGVAVYADPPYAGTKWYSGMPKWEASVFWDTATNWARVSDVYISEYVAPSGWKKVWEKEYRLGTRDGSGVSQSRIEKLFHRGPSS